MAQIIPIRDLRNTTEISKLCNSVDEPVYVTKNGYGDLVIMSMETFERNFAALELKRKLKEATDEVESGAKLLDADSVFKSLREKHGK